MVNLEELCSVVVPDSIYIHKICSMLYFLQENIATNYDCPAMIYFFLFSI